MTTFIVGGRATGKTHRLIQELAKHDNGVLLVATTSEWNYSREKLMRALQERGIIGEEAKARTARQVKLASNPSVLRGKKGLVFVDNLSWVLARFLGVDPEQIESVADNMCVETPQGKKLDPTEDNPHLIDYRSV